MRVTCWLLDGQFGRVMSWAEYRAKRIQAAPDQLRSRFDEVVGVLNQAPDGFEGLIFFDVEDEAAYVFNMTMPCRTRSGSHRARPRPNLKE